MKTVMFWCWLLSPFGAFIMFGLAGTLAAMLVVLWGTLNFVGWSICECLDEISRKLSDWREEDHPPSPVPISKRPPIKI